MMKILIAPDSFKGSLSAQEAASAMADGARLALPDAEVLTFPVADGGEGTAVCLASLPGCEWIDMEAVGPLGDPLQVRYPIVEIEGVRTAVVELAVASGLTLVSAERRDAMRASTFGTGLMAADALRRGCGRVLICLGGSATTDAGTGMLAALGWRFIGARGNELHPCGASLPEIAAIDAGGVHSALKGVEFVAACDVDNPLYGPEGAAYIFSPQKGASEEDVCRLDEGLRSFAGVAAAKLGRDMSAFPGAGAAGGAGFALLSFLGASLRPGIDMVLDAVGFSRQLVGADLVLTGEGRMDSQTLRGKAPAGVMANGAKHGVPTLAVAGKVSEADRLVAAGFAMVTESAPDGLPLEIAMRRDVAYAALRDATSKILIKWIWEMTPINKY